MLLKPVCCEASHVLCIPTIMNKPDVEHDLCIPIDQLVFAYYAVYTSSRRLKTGLRPNHQQEQRESSRQAGEGEPGSGSSSIRTKANSCRHQLRQLLHRQAVEQSLLSLLLLEAKDIYIGRGNVNSCPVLVIRKTHAKQEVHHGSL